MSEVFISYRQTDDEQKQRVRAFGERLRGCGVDVILDQLFLDDNPAGPDVGWDKWSSDRALHTEYVLIVGTDSWFQCYEKTQPPGTGLGAACEADDIRSRIYKAAGVNKAIRVVVFDDTDATNIPDKLDRYHRFHAQLDFANMVRWLGGTVPIDTGYAPRTPIPHNLPSLQPFFGRENELRKIAKALDPESRTWGVLIYGPGGMGKTSLAVLAAYDAPPEDFEKITFVSLKSRELDDSRIRKMGGFLISGLAELLNELARDLGYADITKTQEEQRPRRLLDALRGTRTLLVLDNLESLFEAEQDVVFNFVTRLPPGCRAILTSRVRLGSAAEELVLEELSEPAALATLAKLSESNHALAKTSETDRILLYRETAGKPLLLRWTAGQIGRGNCLTSTDAIEHLRSCPGENDPLEFIFGDLVEDFSDQEMAVLCVLTYFRLPANLEHITELTGYSKTDTDHALRKLSNSSLVVPSEDLKTFRLVPLVADFLRKSNPNVIRERGDRLEERAYALIIENGYEKYELFPVLDGAWPTIAAALPRFREGSNERLQTVCDSLKFFLEFTGHWDELIALSSDGEKQALAAGDYLNAGWRSYRIGWIYFLRGQSAEVLTCTDHAMTHWRASSAGARERAYGIRLRGLAYQLKEEYSTAISAFREAVELWRELDGESKDVALGLNDLAGAEHWSNDLNAAERDYREALRINRIVQDSEGVAIVTGNLAALTLVRKDWPGAEVLARDALSLSEKIGRQELIASNSRRIAVALLRQGNKPDARTYCERAVEIFTRLGSRDLAEARKVLAAC